MNLINIRKILQDLKTSPYVHANVTHKITNDNQQVISISYCTSATIYELYDSKGEKVKFYTDIDEIAEDINYFINN